MYVRIHIFINVYYSAIGRCLLFTYDSMRSDVFLLFFFNTPTFIRGFIHTYFHNYLHIFCSYFCVSFYSSVRVFIYQCKFILLLFVFTYCFGKKNTFSPMYLHNMFVVYLPFFFF